MMIEIEKKKRITYEAPSIMPSTKQALNKNIFPFVQVPSLGKQLSI